MNVRRHTLIVLITPVLSLNIPACGWRPWWWWCNTQPGVFLTRAGTQSRANQRTMMTAVANQRAVMCVTARPHLHNGPHYPWHIWHTGPMSAPIVTSAPATCDTGSCPVPATAGHWGLCGCFMANGLLGMGNAGHYILLMGSPQNINRRIAFCIGFSIPVMLTCWGLPPGGYWWCHWWRGSHRWCLRACDRMSDNMRTSLYYCHLTQWSISDSHQDSYVENTLGQISFESLQTPFSL